MTRPLTLFAMTIAMLFPVMAQAKPVIAAFGDSLTAGYGLPKEEGFTVRLQEALRADYPDAEVVNLGVSGDTTAGGLRRVDSVLAVKPDVIILELGANDMLRGQPPAQTRKNLQDIIDKLKAGSDAKILLAGMKAPRNFGGAYVDQFDAIFPDLAEENDLALQPFFLDGVAMQSDLNQRDGAHPNEKGVALMVKGILPHVQELLDD